MNLKNHIMSFFLFLVLLFVFFRDKFNTKIVLFVLIFGVAMEALRYFIRGYLGNINAKHETKVFIERILLIVFLVVFLMLYKSF
ncbi:MAG: hypothetical protein N4A54_02260 [Peptostreptococcaceae bacterium]|jgi:hypothetical protein|nr:hypothetical protein [Peptostreptococcaceae bacterium]